MVLERLAAVIRSVAEEEAAAGNWAAVAVKLNANSIEKTSGGRKTSYSEVCSGLDPSEIEPVLQAFGRTALGTDGRTKLATTGLDFANPLTVGLIEGLRPVLPAGVPEKLLAFGRWRVSPAADAGLEPVTSDQCREAWLEDRLEARIVNAVAQARQHFAAIADKSDGAALADAWARGWAEGV